MDTDYCSLKLKVVSGRLSVSDMLVIAAVAENFGNGTIHLTTRQGVNIPFIPSSRLDEATTALNLGGVDVGDGGSRLQIITPTYCKAVPLNNYKKLCLDE